MDVAHNYVSEQLHDGNTLAKIILQKLPLDKGRYFALLDPSADKNKIHSFRAGGILPQNSLEPVAFGGKFYAGRKAAHSIPQLVEYLKTVTRSRRCCYFEDLLHRRQDPISTKFKTSTLYYQEEPYLFLQNTHFSSDLAEQIIQYVNAQWYYMNVVSEEEPGLDSEITFEKLQKIASKTISIVIGAYDMEGFVVWEK
jgi:hypothetical protein